MLVFGHIGITLGAALVFSQLIKVLPKSPRPQSLTESEITSHRNKVDKPASNTGMGLTGYIFCGVGAILPDIIDKPVGIYLFSETFGNNGRIFSHSLLFALAILGIGIIYYKLKKRVWFLALSFGVFMHLILDFMWRSPRTFFWPLLGLNFPEAPERGDWLIRVVDNLVNNPAVYVAEIVGIVIVIGFLITWVIMRNKRVVPFMRNRRS